VNPQMNEILIEEGAEQRFLFSPPEMKTFQGMGDRWVCTLYFEQYGEPTKPITILPIAKHPHEKDEIWAAASAFYDTVATPILTTPGHKAIFMFHDQKVIEYILASEPIYNRMVGSLSGLDYELVWYDPEEVGEEIPGSTRSEEDGE